SAHFPAECAAAEKDSSDENLERLAPVLQRKAHAGAEAADTGIVDEHIDAPESLRHFPGRGGDSRFVGDIDGEEARLYAACAQAIGEGASFAPVEIEDGDAPAGLAERLRDRSANAARAARHDTDLAADFSLTRHGGSPRACAVSHPSAILSG